MKRQVNITRAIRFRLVIGEEESLNAEPAADRQVTVDRWYRVFQVIAMMWRWGMREEAPVVVIRAYQSRRKNHLHKPGGHQRVSIQMGIRFAVGAYVTQQELITHCFVLVSGKGPMAMLAASSSLSAVKDCRLRFVFRILCHTSITVSS